MGRKQTLAWRVNERPLTVVGQKPEHDGNSAKRTSALRREATSDIGSSETFACNILARDLYFPARFDIKLAVLQGTASIRGEAGGRWRLGTSKIPADFLAAREY
jgi:hypothetical protein